MFGSTYSSVNISSSGLSAERFRMEVIANNIANAYSTSSPEGGPYRRQQVVFAANLEDQMNGMRASNSALQGVEVVGVQPDQSDFPEVFIPGHPDADGDGMVLMPNVQIPNEMVDLITASRSYEANLRAIRTFRQMAQQTLTLLRGTG